MGLRPTHRNESQDVTPAKAGVHVREELDSRFRGNDVTFDGAQCSEESAFGCGSAPLRSLCWGFGSTEYTEKRVPFAASSRAVLPSTVCSTIVHMRMTVQARLDRRSQVALKRLVRHTGWSPSRVVREGVHVLAACYRVPSARRVIGVGRFASGLPDLASNKKHLRGFGQ
jgi:hypothetical protein